MLNYYLMEWPFSVCGNNESKKKKSSNDELDRMDMTVTDDGQAFLAALIRM